MENTIKHQIRNHTMMYGLLTAILWFGMVMLTLLFVMFSGAIAVEGLHAPTLLTGERRVETLAYGLLSLGAFTFATKHGVFKHWLEARRQLKDDYNRCVANIYRTARAVPEYYSWK